VEERDSEITIGTGEDLNRLFEQYGTTSDAPVSEEEQEDIASDQFSLTPPTDTKKRVYTSLDDLYYAGDEGKALKDREKELNDLVSNYQTISLPITGLYGILTSEDPQNIKDAKAELEQIQNKKQAIYDSVTGDNVTSIGNVGKVIVSSTGEKDFVPGPSATPQSQTLVKATSDTLRGVLALPEAVAGPKLKEDIESLNLPELIPEVSSRNPTVNMLSEVVQLTAGGFAGLSVAAKAEKYTDYISKLPRFKAFMEAKIPQAVSKVTKKVTEGAFPKGTIPSALGAAAVADEDTATLFGNKEKTVGEVKMHILGETMAFGLLFNSVKIAGEATRLTPAVRFTAGKLSGAISTMFASANPNKADNKVLEVLGETVLRTSQKLSKAKTPQEINEAHQELYEEIKEAYPKLTGGGDLEKVFQGLEEVAEGGPSLSELLGSASLMRIEQSLIGATGSKEEASKILTRILGEFDQNRQE